MVNGIRKLVIQALLRAIKRDGFHEFQLLMAEASLGAVRVFGCRDRLDIDPSAHIHDALFNLNSGRISVGKRTFFGHGVSLITGTHDARATGPERETYPTEGCDIVIGDGVWIGSNATILGPCRIGDNAVIGAMALVREDVEPGTLVAGVPARVVRGPNGSV